MSNSYPQYAKSPFPNELNSYITFVDVNASNKPYVDLYYQNFNSGDYESANQVLVNHPELKYVIINADTIQMLFDNIMATQAFVSSETFYEKIGNIVKDKGDYNATIQYELWNIVYYNGLTYMVTGNNGTKPPVGTLPTVTTYFKPIAIRGESGTGMAFYKLYSSSQNYVIADCVPYANRLYVCTQAHTNKQPDINPDYWQKIITIPQAIIWSKTQPEDQDEGNIWCEINDTDSSYITHVKQNDSSYKTYYPISNANFIKCTDGTTVQAFVESKAQANGLATLDSNGHVPAEQLNIIPPNYAGKLIVHVASSDSGNVDGTKVRIRNEQLGSNYVQTIDALGNTTFSLLDNHTYYVVLLDYPSSYYGAAASVTITGGETQELTLTLDTTPDIVGWRINIDTGVIEYTDGAAAYEPMTITDGVFHAGSWDGQWAALVKPCLLKNLIPQYYLKKNSYFTVDYEHQANGTSSDIRTGADGDVMNEVALAYYKTGIETTGEGTFAYFKLAKEPQDGTWCANAYLSRSSVIQDTIYLPAYDGYVLNGKLRSLCGVAPTVSHTIGEFRTYANANGTGYEQANLTQVQYLNNLMILFFKSTNSQLAIGKGVTSASAAIDTGTMNDKPLFWGDQTGTNGMKFMGIENFYGNVRKWLDGVGYLATNHFGYKIVPPFNDDRTGYTDSGVAIPTDGWINRMSRANGYGMLPSATVSAEADSRYKDYFYGLNSSNPVVSWGGFWNYGSYAGAFFWGGYTVSYTDTTIGASLFATPQG